MDKKEVPICGTERYIYIYTFLPFWPARTAYIFPFWGLNRCFFSSRLMGRKVSRSDAGKPLLMSDVGELTRLRLGSRVPA